MAAADGPSEKKTAEALGIPCYDRELLEKIAKESGFDEKYIQEAGEYAPGGFLAAAFSHSATGPNNADYLWNIQYKIISQLAQEGPCVIVGRCADYILRDKADCLRVFIHADMDFRARRVVEVYGENGQKPEQRLRDKDERRKLYYRSFTMREWGDVHNYDVCLNSGRLGLDACVDALVALVRGE